MNQPEQLSRNLRRIARLEIPVGVWAFQVTMSVLAKGDLKSDYGVPWERVRWITQHPEEIDWSGEGLPIERAAPRCDLEETTTKLRP